MPSIDGLSRGFHGAEWTRASVIGSNRTLCPLLTRSTRCTARCTSAAASSSAGLVSPSGSQSEVIAFGYNVESFVSFDLVSLVHFSGEASRVVFSFSLTVTCFLVLQVFIQFEVTVSGCNVVVMLGVSFHLPCFGRES